MEGIDIIGYRIFAIDLQALTDAFCQFPIMSNNYRLCFLHILLGARQKIAPYLESGNKDSVKKSLQKIIVAAVVGEILQPSRKLASVV